MTRSIRARHSNDRTAHLRTGSVRRLSPGRRRQLAVDRISFDIRHGETVALVGESGSGKSVSALSILKLLPYPSAHHPSGRILFKGQELIGADENAMRKVRGDDITMVFQEPMTSLNPLHTIERQVGEILKVHRGMSDREARARTLGASGTWSASAMRKAGSAPIRISSPAASASA